jgi:hypothetical protein
MAKARDLLILKHQDFRDEVSGFFKELNKDSNLRSLFFTNPSLVLRTKLPSLGNVNISEQQDDLANRVLFSVLSNDEFKTFLREYQKKKTKAVERFLKSPQDKKAAAELEERTIRLELAEAMLKFGDKELLSNIAGQNMSLNQGLLSVTVIFVIYLLAIAVILVVHTIVFFGTSGDFAPNFRGRLPIPASALRRIADQLVDAARQAREAGNLTS